MDETSKQKVGILRQRIPAGVKHALTLLEKTNGDIDAAEVLFKDEVLGIIISKTGVEKDVVRQHLINNDHDITATLKCIDEARFTLFERIYARYNDKEETLEQIMYAIKEQNHIEGSSWLDFKLLNLSQEAFCLLVIMEWLSYEGYEGFDIALSFQLDVVTAQIENVLQLPSLANTLRQARDIMESIYQRHKVQGDIKNFIKASSELRKNKDYQRYEQEYINQRTLLISRLYDFVKANIRLIDKTV